MSGNIINTARIGFALLFLAGSHIQLQAQTDRPQVNYQDPRVLDSILRQWELRTEGYHKLSGKHIRMVYDSVFEVETRAEGMFYYEAPDKGRIDIEEIELPDDAKSQRTNPAGKPYSLKSAVPEKWICDGKHIAQAITTPNSKTYEMFDIPEEDQGKNIMDGPLPFLFGLPADQAKQRYNISVNENTNAQRIWLDLTPRREIDLRNWKRAEVILNPQTFLPQAVKLFDPAGTRETVFLFRELEPNKRNGIVDSIFGRDPFDIVKVLKDYQRMVSPNGGQPIAPTGGSAPAPTGQPGPGPATPIVPNQPTVAIMPDTSSSPWKTVSELFKSKGFDVEIRNAGPAQAADQVYTIKSQEPKPGARLQPGQKVILFVYDKVATAGKASIRN